MKFTVRAMEAADRGAWLRMRATLWPDEDPAALAAGLGEFFKNGDAWAFIAEADDIPIGFAEISIRKYANGCETAPVPFLEGIWVQEDFRRQGAGTALIRHVEQFAIQHGFRELGSDALMANHVSHAAHRGWGFAETERVVYFRKALR